MDQDVSRNSVHQTVFAITNAPQFQEALARLRFLEGAATNSSLGRERDALELAASRYLIFSERPAFQDRNDRS